MGLRIRVLPYFSLHSPAMRLEIVQNEPASFGASQKAVLGQPNFASRRCDAYTLGTALFNRASASRAR